MNLEQSMRVCGDCLEIMPKLPPKSVDMILCDLPYGTTQNKWDSVIDLDKLWAEYKRVIKDNGAIVLTGQSLFSAKLMMQEPKLYRYSIIWEKTKAGGFLNAKRMPLQAHEDILVFYKKLPVYNPQMLKGKPYVKKAVTNGDGKNYGKFERKGQVKVNDGERYPRSVIKIANDNHGSLHPTQKPVALFEWLINTYSNEGDVILDNTAGIFTTAIACINTNRKYICIEKEEKYYHEGTKRVLAHELTLMAAIADKEGGKEKTIKTDKQHKTTNEVETKPCNIYGVSQQREQLLAFMEWDRKTPRLVGETNSIRINEFLKANNCG